MFGNVMHNFASDNNAGVHPAVFDALRRVNEGHQLGYGDDEVTARVTAKLRRIFGDSAEIFFVFNGTAANVLSLKAMTNSHNAIICTLQSHLYADECGAPENFTGCKLLPLDCDNGKLSVTDLEQAIKTRRDQHNVQPKVVSISQATELGTVYSPAELKKLTDFAHQNGMYVYMDGARLANAAAFLDTSLAELTVDCGLDVITFGGTKNGLMYGEVIIFFNERLANEFKYIRKQGMQLSSKMRFIAAQFEAILADGLWLKLARHSNAMARKLADLVGAIEGVKVVQPVQSNSVFARIKPECIAPLQEYSYFYVWDEANSIVRWMTAFDTELADVENFAEQIGSVTARFR